MGRQGCYGNPHAWLCPRIPSNLSLVLSTCFLLVFYFPTCYLFVFYLNLCSLLCAESEHRSGVVRILCILHNLIFKCHFTLASEPFRTVIVPCHGSNAKGKEVLTQHISENAVLLHFCVHKSKVLGIPHLYTRKGEASKHSFGCDVKRILTLFKTFENSYLAKSQFAMSQDLETSFVKIFNKFC